MSVTLISRSLIYFSRAFTLSSRVLILSSWEERNISSGTSRDFAILDISLINLGLQSPLSQRDSVLSLIPAAEDSFDMVYSFSTRRRLKTAPKSLIIIVILPAVYLIWNRVLQCAYDALMKRDKLQDIAFCDFRVLSKINGVHQYSYIFFGFRKISGYSPFIVHFDGTSSKIRTLKKIQRTFS